MIGASFSEGKVMILSPAEMTSMLPYTNYSNYLIVKLLGRRQLDAGMFEGLDYVIRQTLGVRISSRGVRNMSVYKKSVISKVSAGHFIIAIAKSLLSNASPFLSSMDWDLLDTRLPHRGQSPEGKSFMDTLHGFLSAPEGVHFHLTKPWISIDYSALFPSIFPPSMDLTPWKNKVRELVKQIQRGKTLSPTTVQKLLGVEL